MRKLSISERKQEKAELVVRVTMLGRTSQNSVSSNRLISKKGRYFVQSDRLKELREFIKAWKGLDQVVGDVFQFRVVIDTNVVLGDIRWLAYRRKNRKARTAVIETIEAGTLEVYVTPALFAEVEQHIARIAIEEGLEEVALVQQWNEYKKRLKVLEPDADAVSRYSSGVDADDAVFIALADKIGAAGVVSNDPHIEMMGGRRISVDCVLSLRDYSRAAAIELSIKCMGFSLGMASIGAIRALYESVKALIAAVTRAPEWLKLVLLLGIVFCAIHPGVRARLSVGLQTALARIKDATPTLISHIADAAALAEQQGALARSHLESALKELVVEGAGEGG